MVPGTFDLKKFREKLLSPTGSKILVAVGLAGILLIAVSSFLPSGSASSSAAAAAASSASSSGSMDAYAKNLDAQLENILASISGVGKAEVMVTFSESTRTLYQQQKKSARSKSVEAQSGGQNQTTQSSSEDEETVVVSSDSGGRALVTAQILPQVKGVLVVCEGGGDAQVQDNIVNAVSTALDIPSNHIFVTQKSGGR